MKLTQIKPTILTGHHAFTQLLQLCTLIAKTMTGVGELNLVELGWYVCVAYATWVFVSVGAKLVKKLGAKLAKLCETEVVLANLPDDFDFFPGCAS